MSSKVVAIVGSYRKGGTIDSAVEAVLEGAREKGAETHTIYLTEQHIEFCTNCRQCMQTPGTERGKCVQQDDMASILTEVEAADAVVLGSPVNQGNVTAITRRFLERLAGYGFWPWGQPAPTTRNKSLLRKAVLVSSCAMPVGFLIPLLTGTASALRRIAQLLNSRTVGTLWIGLAAGEPHRALSAKNRERARRLGWRLA